MMSSYLCPHILILSLFIAVAMSQFGFSIEGIGTNDTSGASVSLGGDVNGDKIADILLGSCTNFTGTIKGQSYVIFGTNTTSFPAKFNLKSLNGTNGFAINGADLDFYTGYSVSMGGDINGDNIDDLIVSMQFQPNVTLQKGRSYVIFGRNASNLFPAQYNLTSLTPADGFSIDGIDSAGYLGMTVSLRGDVNGDKVNDIFVGAPHADAEGVINSGQSYVIFGRISPFPLSFDLNSLNGSNGFVINGQDAYEYAGISAAVGGDVNGDGIDDIILGAREADPDGLHNAGRTYVIFGRNTGFPSVVRVSGLNGSDGFSILGSVNDSCSGYFVSVEGDVNGDRVDDILIGAPFALGNGKNVSGQVYVVFGSNRTAFPSLFRLSSLDGSNGFTIYGADADDFSGRSLSSCGDVNGDNIDDILIGAPNLWNNSYAPGLAYVLFGRPSITPFPSQVYLNSLNGSNGFTVVGIGPGDRLGISGSIAGDVNGDGLADILLSAPNARSINNINAGQSYIIFGKTIAQGGFPSVLRLSDFNLVNQVISMKDQLVELQQHFFFPIEQSQFVSRIGQPTNYTISISSKPLPSWLVFSQSNVTFEGTATQVGTFEIVIVATNENGTVTATFVINIVHIQRDLVFYLDQPQSASVQIPDPSGGVYLYETHLQDGQPLPYFLHFDPNNHTLSLNSTGVKSQTIYVTVTGKDNYGQEQIRYDYSVVLVGSQDTSDADFPFGLVLGLCLGACLLVAVLFGAFAGFCIWKKTTKVETSPRSGGATSINI